MAHSLSAKKRIRQNVKRRARNRARKVDLKDTLKGFTAAIAGTDMAKATEQFRLVTQELGRISAKGTLHKKTAARKRSRLALRLNAAKAKAGAGTSAAKA